MNKQYRLLYLLLILLVVGAACNLPNQEAGTALGLTATAAAQTLEALGSATPTYTTIPGCNGLAHCHPVAVHKYASGKRHVELQCGTVHH